MKVISENVKKTIEFLKHEFDESDYFKTRENEKLYRYYHTIRVANIGQIIAKAENIDEEGLIIGCLLHDISYRNTFSSKDDIRNHGRISAIIARDFLKNLSLDKKVVDEIVYGVAIHVDDEADFEGERTKLALSISDCDNIDRFDTYRLYENLMLSNLNNMTLEEQIEYLNKRITRLKELYNYEMATKTAINLWQDKINYQIDFHQRMLKQLEQGIIIY